MHCLMSSEEWHRKIPFTGYLLAISISVPVVDLESVRRVASGAQNIVFLAGWELLDIRLLRDLENTVEFLRSMPSYLVRSCRW